MIDRLVVPKQAKLGMAVAIGAAALVGSAAMGPRQAFGLFISPLTFEGGFSVALVAFAIAFHNLVWGFAQPFAGAAADRYGAGPVVAAGAVALSAGLALTAVADTAPLLVLGLGVLVGIGISCTSFGVVMTAIGRSAPAHKRGTAMGLANAGGSLGQALYVPVAQSISDTSGMSTALLALAVGVLLVVPLGFLLDRGGRPDPSGRMPSLALGIALRQAVGHRGYCLLTLGFFTCGFQLAFIITHLPNYLHLCGVPAGLGATALAVVGLFNIAGSWACGWLGDRYRQPHILGTLYLIRGAAIALFFVLPKTNATVLVFAAVMGLVWLGTVPLTSGIIARLFGTQHLGALFGICFLSHQIGSFLGAWLGGVVLQVSGSYTPIWIATAAAGLFAALLHFPINDTPAASAAAA